MIYPNGLVHLTSLSGATLALPTTVTVETVQRNWRSHTARLADGREVHVAGPFPQPFDLGITGTLHDANASAAETRAEAIRAILNDAPIEVRMAGSGADRYVYAVPQSMARQELGLGRHGALSIRLRSLSPYWLGDVVVEVFEGLTTQPSTRDVDDVPGNVPPNPIITFTFTTGANVSNPKIINSNTGFTEFTVPGNFTTGDVLVVDTEAMRVYDDSGTTYLDQMGDDFLLNGWPLALGDNTLNIYGSGTIRMDVAVAYQPKWT